MSWAKRNLYFLISAILAVVLLLAAAWFCFSSWAANNANWEQLSAAYAQLGQLKNPSDEVIQSVREQTKGVQALIETARKVFVPVPSIPPGTNRLDDRALGFAVRDTVAALRASAAQHGVSLQQDFAFSFALQQTKTGYDPQSWPMLARQLGEVRTICDTLYACRIASLDAIGRERTTDDAGNTSGVQDYVDAISVTNNGIVISPYQVTFDCFTTELGSVLSSFANGSHTIIVKTIMIDPQDAMSAMEGTPQQTPMMAAARGGLPVVIDEKKLRVTLFLDFVKIPPSQGG
jgi:hypothetical protein